MQRLTLTLTFMLALLSPLAASAGKHLIKQPSSWPVQQTMDRIEAVLKDKGMTVFARIDHKANAEAVGMSLNDAQVLIFGNPKAGTKIMLHDIRAGLDLPLKVYVHQDDQQKTWIVYRNPQSLRESFDLDECATIDNIEAGLGKIFAQALQ